MRTDLRVVYFASVLACYVLVLLPPPLWILRRSDNAYSGVCLDVVRGIYLSYTLDWIGLVVVSATVLACYDLVLCVQRCSFSSLRLSGILRRSSDNAYGGVCLYVVRRICLSSNLGSTKKVG